VGCKQRTKAGFKWFWGWMKPEVVRAGVNMVTALEQIPSAMLAGEDKERVSIDVLKKVAIEEGQNLTTSAAKTLINGLHTMLINGQDISEMGQEDEAPVPDPS